MTKGAQAQAVLAAIARREWLLQMLALGAAGCRRADDRAYARGNTLIAAVDNDRPLCPDYDGEFLVFLPLVRSTEKGDREACLATNWEHSADYREWTYRLRPGVRWHDGRPVTMDDVTFTLELHSRPDSPYFGGLTESVTVHDEWTFTVRGSYWSFQSGMDSFINGGFSPVERWAGGAGYRNPQLTKLLELVRTADPEAADQAYRAMSDLFRADQPVAFLFLFSRPRVVHRRVKGLNAPWRADPLMFTEDLWLEKER